MGRTKELAEDILCNLEHGECLYDREMFQELLKSIDELRETALEEYNKNQD